jgi:hypothetical protein
MDENDLNELKYIFSYLVDSFSYEVERDKKAKEIETITKKLENDKESLESMKSGIMENLEAFVSDYNDFKPYEEKIMESMGAITDQFFTKNSQDALSKVSELKSGIEKDVENGTKIMETFLSMNPFTVLNSNIKVSRNIDGTEIQQSTQCSYGINYTFLLDSKESQFMQNPFLSSIYTGIKIPVAINEENNVVYENMDTYELSRAELINNGMDCTFTKAETDDFFEFIYKNGAPDIEILMGKQGQKNNILDDPDLRAHMDYGILRDALEKLFKEINDLTESRRNLLSLKLDDNEILNTMDFEKIFYRIIGSDYVKSLVKSLPETGEGQNEISKDFIEHRIHVIGRDENHILSTLFE